ncbi:MAG: PID-CTERM protein-sorting domain-containing protein [Bacteroidota bacterium]
MIKIKHIVLFLFLIFCPLFAQEVLAVGMGMGMGPPSPPCGTPPFPPCNVPIDGGISLLTGLGLLYGGKKLFRNKSSK